MSAPKSAYPSVWATRLGYGGLVPFVVLALAIGLADPATRAFSGMSLLAYGAAIASFLGAVHWGLVMRDTAFQSPALLVWGVAPSLVAWVALMLGPVPGLFMVAGLLWACFAVDRVVYPRMQVRGWLPMRLVLTLVASTCCVAGAVGML
jgi:hypothetical protein